MGVEGGAAVGGGPVSCGGMREGSVVGGAGAATLDVAVAVAVVGAVAVVVAVVVAVAVAVVGAVVGAAARAGADVDPREDA